MSNLITQNTLRGGCATIGAVVPPPRQGPAGEPPVATRPDVATADVSNSSLCTLNSQLPVPSVSPWAQSRAALARRFLDLKAEGHSAAEAARIIGESRSSLKRYADLLEAGGEAALESNYENCGRKEKVTLTHQEKMLARKFALKTESVPMGIELMADSPVCRPDVRAVIAVSRQTGRYPKSLMRQVRVTTEEMAAARGAEDLRSVVFKCRRGMFGYDADGQFVPVNSGDIVEFDDVSTDVPFFWRDPDGYWRVGRQILMARDVRSGKWLGVYPVARFGDSYRAEDIARFIELLVRRWGRFKRFRLERGRWENNAVDGIRVNANGDRWGGISSVIQVNHVFSSDAKGGIESAFRPFHKIMGVHGVRIGKTRGEYEKPTDDMLAVNAQKADPFKCGFIPWGETLIHKLVAGCQFLNTRVRRVNGMKPEAPDVTWERDMAAIGGALPSVREEDFWMFKPTIRANGAGIRLPGHVEVSVAPYTKPFDFRIVGDSIPFIERGHRVIVRFDPLMPEAGCALYNFESRPMNRENWRMFQFIGVAPWASDIPQFVDCDGYQSPAVAARKLRTAQVRASFAAIEPRSPASNSKSRISSVHLETDGRGNVLRTTINSPTLQDSNLKPNNTTVSRFGESAANAKDTDTEPATLSTRGTVPADSTGLHKPQRLGCAGLTAPAVPRDTFDREVAAKIIAKREAEARARGELIET